MAGVIPLDHCALLSYQKPVGTLVLPIPTERDYLPTESYLSGATRLLSGVGCVVLNSGASVSAPD